MHEISACVRSAVESGLDFEQLEDDVFTAVCRAGREALSTTLSECDASLEVPRHWRSRGLRDRVIATRLGPLKISRRLFLDEQGRTRYPLDERLGLARGARVSAALERTLVCLSSSVSFREAARVVCDLTGSDVSHATAHSLLQRAGRRIAAEQRRAASDLHDLGLEPGGTGSADPLLAEADGTVVAWQGEASRRGEVRLAVFRGGRAGGRTVSYASVEGAGAFWRAASAECARAYDITSVRSCVLSGDGANWIRGGLEVLPNARFLLDPFHVLLALRDATGSYPIASRLSALLYERGLPAVEDVLADLAKRQPERTGPIGSVLGYLRANADGLWRSTPTLGQIEGHIDKTLANRMKKRGRRWSKEGADAMARVIAARRSGRPVPIGDWSAPAPAAGSRPQAPAVSRPSSEPTPARMPQGGIVSHATGRGFTKTLRDIAGAGRAHWDL